MNSKLLVIIKCILWGLIVILFPIASGIISTIAQFNTIETILLQGFFMVLSLIIPFIFIISGKWKIREIGFNKFNKVNCQRALYFIPVILLFIPVLVLGIYFKSTQYVISSLFLYLFVGIAEEVYFRGIIPKYLSNKFSQTKVILITTLIFGLGHTATIFTTTNLFEALLTIINALLFGYLVIQITLLSGNIIIPIIIHFLFDFETKIIAMSGTELLMAELVRGLILFLLGIWLTIVLRKKKELKPVNDEKTQTDMNKKKKKCWIIICSTCGGLIVIAVLALGAFAIYGKSQVKKLANMTLDECLAYTLENKPDGVITIGIIKDGVTTYKVYGNDGKEISKELHTYEIGSLTKTFTAALIQKAIEEGKINFTDEIDKYLDLTKDNKYPTIEELITHTAGYRGYYLEIPSISNFFKGRNDFHGITDTMIINKLKTLDMKKDEYDFVYSNYGYAILGCILEVVYEKNYTTLVNEFALETGLFDTHISTENGDLGNYWDWQADDAYLSAGALTSNIENMLTYAQLQLDGTGVFKSCHEVIKEINASSTSNREMNINMDSIGMAWITDSKNNIIWHNGGTDNYNCYLGFSKEKDMAVVILSNLEPNYRIPATVMGVKILTDNK